jgi:hypothetical protein
MKAVGKLKIFNWRGAQAWARIGSVRGAWSGKEAQTDNMNMTNEYSWVVPAQGDRVGHERREVCAGSEKWGGFSRRKSLISHLNGAPKFRHHRKSMIFKVLPYRGNVSSQVADF